jgi:hypothetical protein
MFLSQGSKFRRGLATVGRGALKVARGIVKTIASPATVGAISAINPVFAPAAAAAATVARGIDSGIDAIQKRDSKRLLDVGNGLYNSRQRLKTDLEGGYKQAKNMYS